MNWFEKLDNYFPDEEMKSKEQFTALLSDSGLYFKDEGPYHIAMYAEFADFVFIDYLWVSDEARGKGIGRKVIEEFKEKGKTVVLEVEPIDENDPDTTGRLAFYDKLGFTFAESFRYIYESNPNGEETALDIMYTPSEFITEEHIYHAMKIVHEEIHSYRERDFFGSEPQPVKEVLRVTAHNLTK